MLSLLVVGALSFSAPPSCARRDVLRLGAGSVAAACVTVLQFPMPAVAEYYGEPPPKLTGSAYKEALEQAKEFKYVTPSESRPRRLFLRPILLPTSRVTRTPSNHSSGSPHLSARALVADTLHGRSPATSRPNSRRPRLGESPPPTEPPRAASRRRNRLPRPWRALA